jgi:dsDNA-binding SOS-regulon protein
MKELQSGGLKGFKVSFMDSIAVQEEIEFDIEKIEEEIAELDTLIEELDEGILGNIAKAAGKTVAKGAKAAGKAAYGKVKKKVGGSKIGRAYGKAKAGYKKAKSGVKKAKAVAGKIKTAVKTGKAYGDEYDPMLEKLEIIESKLNDYCKILEEVEVEQLAEASGDKEAYKKFFDAALKKFKVSSPAEFKSDEEKKKFFNYIDKNWEGDNEESFDHVKEFKIQSMKDALAKVWDVGEGHNPFKKEDDEKKVKKNKTETGKEPATVDLKPKIDD